MADLADRGDGVREREICAEDVVLDHREDDRRGADLQVRRHLAEVRVADDDVEAAVLLRIAVRFVARVDDGSLERGLQPDLFLEEVGALAQLEGDVR